MFKLLYLLVVAVLVSFLVKNGLQIIVDGNLNTNVIAYLNDSFGQISYR